MKRSFRQRFRRLAHPAYGAAQLPAYDEDAWFNEAIVQSRHQLRSVFAPDSAMAAIEAAAEDWLTDESRQAVDWRDSRPEAFRSSFGSSSSAPSNSTLDECWRMVEAKIGKGA